MGHEGVAIQMAQDTVRWWAILNTVKNLWCP